MSFVNERRADPSVGADGCLICPTATPCNCNANQECVSTVRLCNQCPTNQCLDISSSSSIQSIGSGKSGGGSSAATIAGPVVGGLVAGVVAIFAIYYIWKRRKRARESKHLRQLRLSKESGNGVVADGSNSASASGQSSRSRSAATSPVQNITPTTQVIPSPSIMVEQTNSPGHRISSATLRRSLHSGSGRGTPSPTIVADPFDDSNASIHTQNVPITLVTSHSPSSSLESTAERERIRRITPPTYPSPVADARNLPFPGNRTSLDVSTAADRSTRHLSQSSLASEGSHLSYLIDPPQISMATAVNLQAPNLQVLGGSPLARAHSVKKSDLPFGRESPKSEENDATEDPFADTSAAVILEDTPTPKATSLTVDDAATEKMRTHSMNSVTTVTSSRADSMLEGIPFMDPSDSERDHRQQHHSQSSSSSDTHRASTATFGVKSPAPIAAQRSNTSSSSGSFRDADSSMQQESDGELATPRRPFAGEKPLAEYRGMSTSTSSATENRISGVSDASSDSYRSGYGSMLDGIPFNLALTGDLSFTDGDRGPNIGKQDSASTSQQQ